MQAIYDSKIYDAIFFVIYAETVEHFCVTVSLSEASFFLAV